MSTTVPTASSTGTATTVTAATTPHQMQPDPPPNACTVINDYAKTLVTLGGVLLAVTATFGSQMLARDTGTVPKVLLVITLFVLFLVLGAGLAMQAYLSLHLRGINAKAFDVCANWGTASLFFLVGAGVCFIAFGIAESFYSSVSANAAGAFGKATAFLNQTGKFPGSQKWILRSLDLNNDKYVMEIDDGTLGTKVTVTANSGNGDVIGYVKH